MTEVLHLSSASPSSKAMNVSNGGVDSPSDDSAVNFSLRAYAKMILHAAKHPHCAVNGVLLVKLQPKGQKPVSQKLDFVDVIPLFHQVEGLSPMIEVALSQIEGRANASSLAIAGYYHANRNFKDTNVNVFSQKIADQVANHSPGGRAALITIDNKKLGLPMDAHALIGQLFSGGSDGKWRQMASRSIGVSEEVLSTTSLLIRDKVFTSLVDFDNHLDNLTLDYLNVELNMEIDNMKDQEGTVQR